MDDVKPTLRLLVTVQIFLLFVALLMPLLVRLLQDPVGKFLYGVFAFISIVQALFLRRILVRLQ